MARRLVPLNTANGKIFSTISSVSSMTTAADFYRSFHAQKAAITQLVEERGILDSRNEALAAVNRLNDKCKGLASVLPPYDLQAYSQELDKLYALLDSKAVAQAKKPTRFKFSKSSLTSAKQEQEIKKQERRVLDEKRTQTTVPVTDPNEFKVTKHSRTLFSSYDGGSQNLVLADIDHAAIFLKPSTPFATAKVDNVSHSIIYIDSVKGAVYLNNLDSCVVITACHQFRMHKSTRTDLFLSCGSGRPIIEHCSGLRFAQFSFDTVTQIHPWNAVDDFNWLDSSRPSANWHLLSPADDYSSSIKPAVAAVLGSPAQSRSVDVDQEFSPVTLFG